MPYNEDVAKRVRSRMIDRLGFSERKMFGGVCFMINGNMCCGVIHDELMLRLGNDLATASLDEAHTRPMDFTGKPMRSMLFVEPAGFASEQDLQAWIERAEGFVRTIPPK